MKRNIVSKILVLSVVAFLTLPPNQKQVVFAQFCCHRLPYACFILITSTENEISDMHLVTKAVEDMGYILVMCMH